MLYIFKYSKSLFFLPKANTTNDSGFDCVSVVDLGSKDAKDKPTEGVNQKAENIRCAVAGKYI